MLLATEIRDQFLGDDAGDIVGSRTAAVVHDNGDIGLLAPHAPDHVEKDVALAHDAEVSADQIAKDGRRLRAQRQPRQRPVDADGADDPILVRR